MKRGDKLRLLDNDKDKAYWGSNDLPNDYLKIGEVYTVDIVEIHSWHTKIYLKEIPGKKFNSTHFEMMEEL